MDINSHYIGLSGGNRTIPDRAAYRRKLKIHHSVKWITGLTTRSNKKASPTDEGEICERPLALFEVVIDMGSKNRSATHIRKLIHLHAFLRRGLSHSHLGKNNRAFSALRDEVRLQDLK
jgi:hypothetical protein